ncbi:zinc ribbon domain-containing protein [Desulfonatronovibrio magnus]
MISIPSHYTSRTCPDCGNRVKKTLSTSTHVYSCGCRLHRGAPQLKIFCV